MKLLLIEDDVDLADALKKGLENEGFQINWASDGLIAKNRIQTDDYDLLILDMGLPLLSGLDFLKSFRKNNLKTPVIVLTARDSTEDCVGALNVGADDYMTKPFDLSELVARIHAKIRRSSDHPQSVLKYQHIELDPDAHTVKVHQQPIYLARREFSLLKKFLENPGKVLSRETLMQAIYDWDDEVDSNTLEVHIHNLRKKLDTHLIRTIRGIGYILEKI